MISSPISSHGQEQADEAEGEHELNLQATA
jgi:hypothetical protein